jgi:hypothetical protein
MESRTFLVGDKTTWNCIKIEDIQIIKEKYGQKLKFMQKCLGES